MFTGIIEAVGRLAALETQPSGGRLRVEAPKLADRLGVGASVAVNGVCLTVAGLADSAFLADLSPETLERTSFRALKPGREVNLELPLTAASPLGGHIVQGHVDGTGRVRALEAAGENYLLRVEVPEELERYLAEKGSVAVDGISLTVAAIEGTLLTAAIIPYTYRNTNLRGIAVGEPVNLECDILAKYIAKLLERGGFGPRDQRRPGSQITLARLLDEGF